MAILSARILFFDRVYFGIFYMLVRTMLLDT